MKNLTYEDFIDRLHSRLSTRLRGSESRITKIGTVHAIEELCSLIHDEVLTDGKRLRIPALGVFKLRTAKPRQVKDPNGGITTSRRIQKLGFRPGVASKRAG